MGYIDQNLISGESVTYKARLHWILFVKPSILSLVLAGSGGLIAYLAPGGSPDWLGTFVWIGAGLVVIATIPLIVAAVNRSSAEFAVTNKRVILKIGFIQKKTAE